MNNHTNGSGDNNDSDDKKIVKFPTLADRDRARKEKLKQEETFRKQYRAENKPATASDEPMFNFGALPPFTKFFTALMLIINIPLLLFSSYHLQAIYTFGFTPAAFTQGTLSIFALITPISHMLIHGGWMHLAFNAVMMLSLGIMFEKMAGTRALIKFFFACGLAGAATFVLFDWNSTTPMVGASGGISGLFAAALIIMHGQNRFGSTTGATAKYGPWPIILLWLALMLGIGFLTAGNIAWQAHIGGYVMGALLFRSYQKGIIKL